MVLLFFILCRLVRARYFTAFRDFFVQKNYYPVVDFAVVIACRLVSSVSVHCRPCSESSFFCHALSNYELGPVSRSHDQLVLVIQFYTAFNGVVEVNMQVFNQYVNNFHICVIFSVIRASVRLLCTTIGLFSTEGGILLLQSRHLRTEELSDPEISVACAHIMAHFHKLQMPIVKEPKWLSDVMTR